MAKRLSEIYTVGDAVEITFGDDEWQPGQVVRHEHPGIWVKTEDGRLWFVTNRRKIRARDEG